MTMGHVPPVDYDELVVDYKAGSTIQELAARTGWAHRTVRALLEERGVLTPSNKQRYSDAELEKLLRRREREARLRLARQEREAQSRRARQERIAKVERLEREAALASRLLEEREARRRQQRNAEDRRRKEQARLEEFFARRGKTLDAIAAYRAETEFERRRQAQLVEWLREYGDILTDQAHT